MATNSRTISAAGTKTVAICGNPNSGKSTIFNAITGLKQKVGNYPGVTVEKVTGFLKTSKHHNQKIRVVDIPGSYSLSPFSPDEHIAASALCGCLDGSTIPDAIICVIDATNLERGLYFLMQVMQIGQPIVVALNMIDLAERKGIKIDYRKLSEMLGGIPVVPVIGNRGGGTKRLKLKVAEMAEKPFIPANFHYDKITEEVLRKLTDGSLKRQRTRAEYLRLIFDAEGPAENEFKEQEGDEAFKIIVEARERLRQKYGSLAAVEIGFLTRKASDIYNRVTRFEKAQNKTTSEKVDRYLLHPVLGPIVLLVMMVLVFQAIFSWAEPFMNFIDTVFSGIGARIESGMIEGPLRSLLVDGVIGGVGSILIFIPQIAILFIFIAILEDSGYMARGAFLVDRLFRWCGLSGKSFIPMLSSFACAVPGIMATRTIENRKLRIITIMVAPLMTCSARLPVYSIMIAAFIPYKSYFGIFNLQGLVLTMLYLLGMITAVVVSLILNRTVFKTERGTFLMEMPSYKIPMTRSVLVRVLNRLKVFLVRAGSVILAITIIIWALSFYPRSGEAVEKQKESIASINAEYEANRKNLEDRVGVLISSEGTVTAGFYESLIDQFASAETEAQLTAIKNNFPVEKPGMFELVESAYAVALLDMNHKKELAITANRHAGELIRESYFGKMGRAIEPIFKPLGWDWKITVAVLSSFPAREVIIATLGTIYNLGVEVDQESSSLIDKMRQAKWESGPNIGKVIFTPAVALSIMVFFALCCQCMPTLVTIKQETGSWRYPVFVFSYMSILAYVGALVIYQVFKGVWV